jgi:hypothetical protein
MTGLGIGLISVRWIALLIPTFLAMTAAQAGPVRTAACLLSFNAISSNSTINSSAIWDKEAEHFQAYMMNSIIKHPDFWTSLARAQVSGTTQNDRFIKFMESVGAVFSKQNLSVPTLISVMDQIELQLLQWQSLGAVRRSDLLYPRWAFRRANGELLFLKFGEPVPADFVPVQTPLMHFENVQAMAKGIYVMGPMEAFPAESNFHSNNDRSRVLGRRVSGMIGLLSMPYAYTSAVRLALNQAIINGQEVPYFNDRRDLVLDQAFAPLNARLDFVLDKLETINPNRRQWLLDNLMVPSQPAGHIYTVSEVESFIREKFKKETQRTRVRGWQERLGLAFGGSKSESDLRREWFNRHYKNLEATLIDLFLPYGATAVDPTTRFQSPVARAATSVEIFQRMQPWMMLMNNNGFGSVIYTEDSIRELIHGALPVMALLHTYMANMRPIPARDLVSHMLQVEWDKDSYTYKALCESGILTHPQMRRQYGLLCE